MAIGYGRLTPVRKAGSTLSIAAHHGGHRVSHGAAGRAAYLTGGRIVGNDPEMVTDYRNKFGVEHSELMLPGGGTCDRKMFWNAVDLHKTQSANATVARDMILAFPHEFSQSERRETASQLAKWIADRYQVAVDYGLHLPETRKGSSEKNFHGHFLISERTVSPRGDLGKIQRQLNQMVCTRVDESRGRTERKPTAAKEIRMAWERIANEVLVRNGHNPISMSSYAARGIDKRGEEHRGAIKTREIREAAIAKGASLQPASERGSSRTADAQRDADNPKGLGAGKSSRTAPKTAHALHRTRHPTRSGKEIAKELASAQKMLARTSKDARRGIDEIRARMKREAERIKVRGNPLGRIDTWIHDPAKAALRTWQRMDYYAAIEKRLQAVQRPRQATPEEARELKRLRMIRSRADKLNERIADAQSLVAKMPDVEFATDKSRIVNRRYVEELKSEAESLRNIDRPYRPSRGRDQELEL